jgi:hypothetical protein
MNFCAQGFWVEFYVPAALTTERQQHSNGKESDSKSDDCLFHLITEQSTVLKRLK